MTRAHMSYLSFVIYTDIVKAADFKDERSKNLMILLAKIYALK